jgi:RsiW-degrading membrane proteinase PrsW (M82 family)
MDLAAAFSLTGDDPFTSALLQAVLFILVIRFLDLWEREPLWLIVLMAVWGATGAIAIAGPVNTAWLNSMSPELQATFGPAIVAPLVEELAKGAALVAVLFASRWAVQRHRAVEFDGPVDGLVYGAAVGLGFAFNENNFYFLNSTAEENVIAGFAVLELREGFFNLGTLGHAIYTGIFGAGLGLATWSQTRAGRVGWPLLGLGVAMLLHAFNNGFAKLVAVLEYGYDEVTTAMLEGGSPEFIAQVQDTFDTARTIVEVVNYAMVAVFACLIVLGARYQQRVLRYELAEEANAGLISREEWETVPSYTRRLKWYRQLFVHGVRTRDFEPWRAVRRTHHELGELAFLKWRLRRVGGPATEVERRRQQIAALRQQQGGALPTAQVAKT